MTTLGFHLPKARKAHRCDYCLNEIAKSTVYARWAWVDSGSVTTVRAHPACHVAAGLYYSEMGAHRDEWSVDDDAIRGFRGDRTAEEQRRALVEHRNKPRPYVSPVLGALTDEEIGRFVGDAEVPHE